MIEDYFNASPELERRLTKRARTILREEGLTIFIKKASTYTLKRLRNLARALIELTRLGYVFGPFIIKRYRKFIVDIKSIDEAIDFAYSFTYLGVSICPQQDREEIKNLLNIIQRLKPQNVLEIGTAGGGTLFLFSKACDQGATIISIDCCKDANSGYPKWKSTLYKSLSDSQNIHLIRADSHDYNTSEQIRKILGDKEIDFCFIDGDHSYQGVKRDFEMYSRFVRKGGLVALHDIDCPKHLSVKRYWQILKESNHNCFEIIADTDEISRGIGVLYIP